MDSSPRCCEWRGIALAIVAAGLIAGSLLWLAKDSNPPSPTFSGAAGAVDSGRSDAESVPVAAVIHPQASAVQDGEPESEEGNKPLIVDVWPSTAMAPPPLEIQRGEPAWETEMKQIRMSGLAPAEQAHRLLANLKTSPPDAYQTLVEQAVAILRDADYNAVALPVLLDAGTSPAAIVALNADLLERPDAIALPALLRMAQTPNHPLASSARDTLELLTGEEHGTDWEKWREAVSHTLQQSGAR